MADDEHELLTRILAERGRFGHREHLELAWNLLGRHELAEAQRAAGRMLRHLARLHGMPDRYHETLTASWVHLVALHRVHDAATSFDVFVAHNQGLLDSHLLDRHYSPALTASDAARARWAEPDLRAFPAVA